jgi:TolB-like protein/tetratricopeptide (TPR) repeat protein
MGEVYRARDTRLERQVAIKVLPEHLAQDRDALQRFEREAQTIAALSHPNILAIHDFGSDHGIAYCVTELLEGQTLRERLESAPLPWRKAVDIAVALADGLAAAHTKKIFHRDLKPENIFLNADGHVKILDFGLAHVETPQADDAATMTQPGVVMGTVGYMSPEQLRGEPARAPTDIFALGTVLYEMIAGRRAFSAGTAQDTLSAILRDNPPDLAASGKSLPAELIGIVSHCLEKNPGERFQSARDLAFALKAVAGSGAAGRVTTGTIDSIAVLPFANVTRDPEVEYLSDGVTETIINGLTRLPGLRVAPRSTVFRYKGQDIDPQVVGQELAARVVLTGRILQRGDTLVVAAELTDVARQSQLWGERFKRKLADIFSIEEDIAGKISESLRGRLTGDDRKRLARRSTEDSEAYRLYLRGRHAHYRRTPTSLQEGLRYFAQAIERDPDYALAYSGLCDSYVLLGWIGAISWPDAASKFREAAVRAVAIDDSLAEAHASLGMVRALLDWSWTEAEREFRRAIELDPRYILARTYFAFIVLAPAGRFEEATGQIRAALDAEPLSPVAHAHAALVYLQARRPQQAIEHARTILELDPGYVVAQAYLGMAHDIDHRHDEAIAELQEAVQLFGEAAPNWRGALAHALALAGRREEAEVIFADLLQRAERRYIDPFWMGLACAGLNQPDRAIDYLEHAADDRSSHLVFRYSLFDSLHTHPRFVRLMARMGLLADFRRASEPHPSGGRWT